MIAALTTFLSSLCYCELAAKVPKSGSVYTYIYLTIGEFMAFCMGWNLILEYLIGISSDARAFSQNVDSFFNQNIEKFCRQLLPHWRIDGFIDNIDFLAFFITITVTLLLVIGVKESSRLNKLTNLINILIIIFIIIYGSTRADMKNWNIDPIDDAVLNEFNNTLTNDSSSHNFINVGNGGFFPFGTAGILKGVKRCIYAFIGFDAITSTSKTKKQTIIQSLLFIYSLF
jgi:solute carrier family 7 (cationic amino acid transporter), member 3